MRADGRTRSVSELVALVQDCQAVVNQATAIQLLAMAHLAAIEDVALEDGTVVEQHRGLGHQRLDAPALISDQLGLSDAAACSRMAMAVDVVTRVPAVHDAMASGRLDGYRAGVVADELRDAPPEVCREVVARIEGSLGTEPPATLRRRVRRALGAVDADLLRSKAARARAARSLRRWPGDEPGVDTWLGSFPVEQARSGWAVVDGLARQYVLEGRANGVDEARADALMDLIHSRATGTFVVQLAVPAEQLASAEQPESRGSDPTTRDRSLAPAAGPPRTTVSAQIREGAVATVAGLGMAGDAVVRREWLEDLADLGRGSDTPSTREPGAAGTGRTTRDARSGAVAVHAKVIGCHPDTGALVPTAPGTRSSGVRLLETGAYRPPAALVDLVKARDGRCRFPGCTVSAVFCDLDHVRPWPSGATEANNLMCLCRRHHRVKQSLRWSARIEPDATVTWTDPTGRLRTTLPLDFLQLEQHPDHPSLDPSRINENQLEDGAPRGGHPTGAYAGSMPADEVGVLWSTWEDELAHHLLRVKRDRRRRPRPRLTVSRPLLHRQEPGRQEGPRRGAHPAGRDQHAPSDQHAPGGQRAPNGQHAPGGELPPF